MLTLTLLFALALPAAPVATPGDATVVVVVRHAEKATDDPRDPGAPSSPRRPPPQSPYLT